MERTRFAGVTVLFLGLACSSAEPPSPPLAPSTSASAATPPRIALASAMSSALASPSATPTGSPETAAALDRPPALSWPTAVDFTFPTGLPAEAESCKSEGAAGSAAAAADEAKIRCLLKVRFNGDEASRELALGFYEKLGSVIGVIREYTMDGGWRGDVHVVPELPVGQYRKHLQWVKTGFEGIDAFFTALAAKRPAGSKAHYRHRALGLRFFRSVGRTTPSAYARDWEVAYNVSGSLHASPEAVRETLFHEVFHLNDAGHGHWSDRVLAPIADGILQTCGQKTACLAPYAPGTTMVRGGTYYAFQKGNGVGEYAAELATRYFTEHQVILRGERLKAAPFKCGPAENAKAWSALVDEFFGVDLTAPCAAK